MQVALEIITLAVGTIAGVMGLIYLGYGIYNRHHEAMKHAEWRIKTRSLPKVGVNSTSSGFISQVNYHVTSSKNEESDSRSSGARVVEALKRINAIHPKLTIGEKWDRLYFLIENKHDLDFADDFEIQYLGLSLGLTHIPFESPEEGFEMVLGATAPVYSQGEDDSPGNSTSESSGVVKGWVGNYFPDLGFPGESDDVLEQTTGQNPLPTIRSQVGTLTKGVIWLMASAISFLTWYLFF